MSTHENPNPRGYRDGQFFIDLECIEIVTYAAIASIWVMAVFVRGRELPIRLPDYVDVSKFIDALEMYRSNR